MHNPLNKFILRINQKSSFYSISLDRVIKQYEEEIIQLEDEVTIKNQNIKSNLTNYHYFNVPLYKKYAELSELYQELAILVALKLTSKNSNADIGTFLSAEEVNKSAGKYRLELALGIKLNTEEVPLITFRLFSPSQDFTSFKSKLIQEKTEMKQFAFHACNVNKQFYLLPIGADFMCGGCQFQQGYDNVKFIQNEELLNFKSWVDSTMYLSDFHEYIQTFIPNLNHKVIWTNSNLVAN